MSIDADESGLAPEEAFAALGSETRIDILQALWEADDPLAYSDLKRHVGMHDSGQFNYHLDKLVGVFVSRERDHYVLRETGNWLIRALLAGTITEDPSFESVALDTACSMCGAYAVEASYEDDNLTVRCTAHRGAWEDMPEGLLITAPFPPAGLTDRTPDEVARAVLTWVDIKVSSMHRGVCPECAARVRCSVDVLCDEHEWGFERNCPNCDSLYAVRVDYTCENCALVETVPVFHPILKHPDVVAFFHERGLTSTDPTWEIYGAVDRRSGYREEVRSDDPLEFLVTIPVHDDELQVTLDRDLNVLDVNDVEG